jgi:hypothetical protein
MLSPGWANSRAFSFSGESPLAWLMLAPRVASPWAKLPRPHQGRGRPLAGLTLSSAKSYLISLTYLKDIEKIPELSGLAKA